VPHLIALFANSSRYAGQDSGHASYRAYFWRELDATRTGIPLDEGDPLVRYAEFALEAGARRAENGRGEFHSFRSLLGDASLSREDWQFHLSTLFPEVRPKEFFEIRSPDTIAPEHLAAPLAFVTGLVYDDLAARTALDFLSVPNSSLLRAAGREGLGNATIKAAAASLIDISMEGAARLPRDYLSDEHRDAAAIWLKQKLADA